MESTPKTTEDPKTNGDQSDNPYLKNDQESTKKKEESKQQ